MEVDEAASSAATPDPEGPERPSGSMSGWRRHRRRWLTLAIAAAMVLGAVTFVTVRWSQNRARPVDIDAVAAPTGTTLPAAADVLRPPQGVYRFEGSGTDQIDKPHNAQAEGPSMPGTVRHRKDGCWTFRIDYSTNHWQRWDYCPRAGGLVETGGAAFQRWNFGAFVNETSSSFECRAVVIEDGQQPGDEWRQSCTGTSTGIDGVTHSTGPFRFVGTETLVIGGRQVQAHHYHRERTNTGNQEGTEEGDVWFSASTGMPLRNRHEIATSTDTVIGRVRYTEEGEFELTSLDPAS